jgi:hypothetical protein
MNEAALPLSRIVRLAEVPEDGLTVRIEADDESLIALANFLGIPAVEAFTAEMTVERWRRDGLAVRGRIEAEVVQSCVVTLAPVTAVVTSERGTVMAANPDRLMVRFEPDPDEVGARVDVVLARRTGVTNDHRSGTVDHFPDVRRDGVRPVRRHYPRNRDGVLRRLAIRRQ